ncbi:tetratricopeptide repeat protein [Streptomyces sp. NPDC054956]
MGEEQRRDLRRDPPPAPEASGRGRFGELLARLRAHSGASRRAIARYCQGGKLSPAIQVKRESSDWGRERGNLSPFLDCFIRACLTCRKACSVCPVEDVAAGSTGCKGLGQEEITRLVEAWQQAWSELPEVDGCELPPTGTAVLAGRQRESAELSHLLLNAENLRDDVARAVAVIGTPGVGKSTLAVDWAHKHREYFPDGALYADLHGFRRARHPRQPADVLPDFLRALGVPEEEVQGLGADLEALHCRFQGEMAGRRMIVVLDDAADAAQVTPLLCRGNSSFIVTTRSTHVLATAHEHEGAQDTEAGRPALRPLPLDVLTPDASLELMASLIGPARVQEDPEAARRIVDWCAALPLALSVVGVALASRPTAGLADAAAQLETKSTENGSFKKLREVFRWSYEHLPTEQADLFRALGLHPGPEFGAEGAAALLGCTFDEAVRRIDALAAAHLIQPRAAARFSMHELLKSYAQERAEDPSDLPPAERQAAIRRLVVQYARLGDATDRVLAPERRRVPLTIDVMAVEHGGGEGVGGQWAAGDPATTQQALAWCDLERSSLLPVVELAVQQTDDEMLREMAWQIPALFGEYLYLRRDWKLMYDLHQAALGAAASSSQAAEAWICTNLGLAAVEVREPAKAVVYCERALELTLGNGDRMGAGIAANNLGLCHLAERDFARAEGCFAEALAHHEAAGSSWGTAHAMWNLGRTKASAAQWREATEWYEEALGLHRSLGHDAVEGTVLFDMAMAHSARGYWDQAVHLYRQALHIREATGDLLGTAAVLEELGTALKHLGDDVGALAAWRSSLSIFEELAHPRARQVRLLAGPA